MGCIPSKEVVTRSLSFQEELNRSFQRRSKSIPAWEELLSSHNASDQLIAFVCPANELPNTDPKTALETATGKTDEKNSLQPKVAVGMNDSRRLSRSKSCQMYAELYKPDSQNEGLSENKLDWRDKNFASSRSFHTVKEYDTLVERIYMTSSTRVGESSQDNDSSLNENVHKSNSTGEDQANIYGSSDTVEGTSEHESSSSSSSSSSTTKWEDFENFPEDESGRETGWKRKAVAQGLTSLDVSPVEFPAVARFRQWFHVDGQIYSPGSYVTPKFGNYNNKVNLVKREDGSDSVFSPEIVAAFEECMKQLEAEEESIRSYIEGYLQSNKETENPVEEDLTMQIL